MQLLQCVARATFTVARHVQVYKAEKTRQIVLWVGIAFASLFGLLAVILLTAPWWDKRHRNDQEAQTAAQEEQQEPLLGPETPGSEQH